jgi:S-disulfanyl-L-cysteine oxidoreductase SoxD
MCTRKLAGAAAAALLLAAGAACADGPNLGKRLNAAEIAVWDLNVLPDGGNLPPGSGTPAQGARIFAQKCVACHGEMGKGGISAGLVGGGPLTTISGAQKTIANFWPYPTTVFDIIRRAMPWQQPKSLTNDEVYALTAYIFALNKLIGEDATMNAETLPAVRMPNRDGFIVRFPEKM